jgi:endoplasmic reticulum chaperone BiP
LIGRKLDDSDVKKDMKHWPFKVIEKQGKPAIQVKYRGEKRDFVSALDFFIPFEN